MVNIIRKNLLAKAAALLLGLAAIFTVVWDEISSPLLYHTLRGNTANFVTTTNIYIPPSLDADSQRKLSINLGGGDCKWEPPVYDVPEDLDFHKTFIAGFPSGDKRMVYLQMEALAGFPAKDEWDFAYMGMSNHPFIKGNYPHHEGIWGWADAADQVVMMVPNIRRSMVEYHDILWDLGYASTWEDASLLRNNLFREQPDLDDYYEWRDARVLDEACWYGWFIDYWMEGGLMRDIFTHKLTTKEHWDDLMLKPFYTRAELDYDLYVSNETDVTPSYDTHCANGDISDGCEPVAIISADKLLDYTDGPAETSAIASALTNDARTGQYVIAPEAWDCIWEELIQNKKGPRIISDRPGYSAISGLVGYNFSAEMVEGMLAELDRLIAKYGGAEWNTKQTANRLVEILTEHRALIQVELDQVNSGERRLREKDFLGPQERRRRHLLKSPEKTDGESDVAPERKKHTRYFIALEQKRFENKRREIKGAARKSDDEANSDRAAMSDGDFIAALSNALAHINTLEAAGGMAQATATELVESIRKVARQARVVLMKD
mmetsp:Transcript_17720/g.38284  ORF Transcript_17720/g.38284 Transcript_17720/m.38284 type:complete len:549 (+) Transcript_17720:92-1738(+)|eukprot:CAMPEP_0172315050 /NCGR_PEP_ID=MMETSP1058-20130122/23959_1 /TAXON_ID=83371 /ORGANISM="Detonula confervacea, Strain CCMP 353" /LENGTH=548 /DNA_ID=CAMNT_0013029041 /DNA_START=27 /DNA_END=1673 /DNA_ORIENTATION=-